MPSERNILVVGAGYWGSRVASEYLNLLESSGYSKLYVYDPFIKETKIRDSRISFVDSIEQAYGKVELAHVCTYQGMN